MKKFLCAIFVTACLFLSGCGGDDNPIQPVVWIEPSLPTNNALTVRGIVESAERRNVYTNAGLTIARVYASEGEHVFVGQILAVLDTAELELNISAQRAALTAARESTQNSIREARRMLDEATANLARNTNMTVLSAEASLSVATTTLESARQNYTNATQDFDMGNNPQILQAESALRSAATARDSAQETYTNTQTLYEAGIATREDLRQAETSLTLATNMYSDAQTARKTTHEAEQRNIERLRAALSAAEISRQNAHTFLTAARSAASQEIERFQAALTSAEIAANLEPQEIAIQLLERQLEDSTITSPINGIVTAVHAQEGALGMGVLFVVEDASNLRVITRFREYDIAHIETGMAVTITPSAPSSTSYEGEITRVSFAAAPNSHVVEFEAEVAVISTDTSLRIGMNTRIEVH